MVCRTSNAALSGTNPVRTGYTGPYGRSRSQQREQFRPVYRDPNDAKRLADTTDASLMWNATK